MVCSNKKPAALLADAEFRTWISGVIFACGDPLAAGGGVAEMDRVGLKPAA